MILAVILSGILALSAASPIHVFESATTASDSASASTAATTETPYPGLLSYKDGTFHVNLLGSGASAGLGALLSMNPKDGGPHLDAKTLFGVKTGIGLYGHPEGEENSESHSIYVYGDDPILGVAKKVEKLFKKE